jgi:hypothetical protein
MKRFVVALLLGAIVASGAAAQNSDPDDDLMLEANTGGGFVGYTSFFDPQEDLGGFAHFFNLRLGANAVWTFPVGPISVGPEAGLGFFVLQIQTADQEFQLIIFDFNALANITIPIGPVGIELLGGYTMHTLWGETFDAGHYVSVGGRVTIDRFFVTGLVDIPFSINRFAGSPIVNQGNVIAIQIGARTFF